MVLTRGLRWTIASGLCTLPACGQGVPPDYGFEWQTVGAPGNRATIPSEVPWDPNLNIGAVGYEFRMTRSKLDVTGYVEFVRAFAPYWAGSPTAMELTGPFVQPVPVPGGGWDYRARPGADHYAARIEWEMAARYCNWLHNDKSASAEAFATGVYDTSTFHAGAGGWTANLTPLPGAKFWIPNLDEWTKAAHYDPNRYGPGQGGYWQYPDGSDQPLTMGPPGQGETIGDLPWQQGSQLLSGSWDLGQYPDTLSPWGLQDISGSVPDYIMSLPNPGIQSMLSAGGSMAGHIDWFNEDRIDFDWAGAFYGDNSCALRIAGIVPSPTSSAALLVAGVIGWGRRRSNLLGMAHDGHGRGAGPRRTTSKVRA